MTAEHVPLAEQIHGVNNVIAWVERQRLPGGCMEDLECDRSLSMMRATVATLQRHQRAMAVLRKAQELFPQEVDELLLAMPDFQDALDAAGDAP